MTWMSLEPDVERPFQMLSVFVRHPRMEFAVRTLKFLTLGVVAATCLLAVAPAQAIDNVRGKQYQLTPKHGPWMVMVTSFRNVRDADMKTDGLTAEQAAAELVFELREKGIPAYTFSQDAVKSEIDTQDRLGRDDRRIYASQRDMICVLAGNYESIDDNVAQKTLKFIKKFHPKFLRDAKSGAILRADAADRGPLSGAFMTINPMIKPEEVVQRNIDKETKFLNTGIDYPLVRNPHKYTLRVATFAGKSATPFANSQYRGNEGNFDLNVRKPAGYNIILAGEDADQLTHFLRQSKNQLKKEGQLGKFSVAGVDEAYVYHDKFQSIVTIGGFDSPDDPRIRLVAEYYGPHLVPDMRLLPLARRNDVMHPVTEDEIEKLPKMWSTHTEQLFPMNRDRDTPPLQTWTFDTEPKVIPVPRIK